MYLRATSETQIRPSSLLNHLSRYHFITGENIVYQGLPPLAWNVPTIGVRFNLSTVVHSIGIKGSWRWQISNFSRSKTFLICDSRRSDVVMRTIEPLTGISLGVPMRINRSPM